MKEEGCLACPPISRDRAHGKNSNEEVSAKVTSASFPVLSFPSFATLLNPSGKFAHNGFFFPAIAVETPLSLAIIVHFFPRLLPYTENKFPTTIANHSLLDRVRYKFLNCSKTVRRLIRKQ